MTKAERSTRVLHAYIDGASRGNPGESGIGIVLRDNERKSIFSGSGYVGRSTNNEAEYHALVTCLKKIKSLLVDQTQSRQSSEQNLTEWAIEKVIIHSDSELLVNQMRGSYKVKDERLKKLFRTAARLVQALPVKVEFHRIGRDENQDADMLANYGIQTRIRLRV